MGWDEDGNWIDVTPQEAQAALRAPFPADAVEWRAGNVSERRRSVQLLAYIDARAVSDRLDDVFGTFGWDADYRVEQGGFICRITCRLGDVVAHKEDGAQPTDFEPFKGGLSDSFKRAAVKWGVGAYLYGLDATWVDVQEQRPRGPFVRLLKNRNGQGLEGYAPIPALPAWALPAKAQPPAPADAFAVAVIAAGYTLDKVVRYCELREWPDPRTLPKDRQEKFLAHLRSEDGQADVKTRLEADHV